MDHSAHQKPQNNKKEYLKFAAVIVYIAFLAIVHTNVRGFSTLQFLESFMGSFFLVFGSFKLRNLREFAYGFMSYDIIARRSLAYSYLYPFIQIAFAASYLLLVNGWIVDLLVLIISLVSSIGVVQEISRGSKIRCVCLGSVIKLPLSRISIVEDFGMAIMAAAMLVLR